MTRATRLTALLVSTALAGCASNPGAGLFGGPPTGKVYELRQVQQRPVLRGCSQYTDPLRPVGVRAAITVRFVVDENGSVKPGSAEVIRGQSYGEEWVEEARSAAASCVFTPAKLKDNPVAVRMSKTFLFT